MDDFDIVEMYWDRNEDAIYHTDKKYNRYCSRIAYNILFNAEDTKECVNDTWLKAWETIPPQRPENLAAYLGKITRNLAINLHEKLTALKRGGRQTKGPYRINNQIFETAESNGQKSICQKILVHVLNKGNSQVLRTD